MFKSILLLLFTFINTFSMSVHNEAKDEVVQHEALSYTVVEPTKEEIDGIEVRLRALLGNRFENYDCRKSDVYSYIFEWGYLNYADPGCGEEAEKYIACPMDNPQYDGNVWFSYVYSNDPQGYFDPIPDGFCDEEGNVDWSVTYEYPEATTLGHLKFSGEYVDWLVQGVWNGKTDHETFFKFGDEYEPGEYGTELYYHNGYYYTPHRIFGLGGPQFWSEVESVEAVGDGKYEVAFNTSIDEDDVPEYLGKAVVAMKESSNGFRFWSIYSIEYERIVQND